MIGRECNTEMNDTKRNFDAAIFDLDGTLLNTLDDIADSVNAALATMGFPTHDVSAYKRFVGEGVMLLVQRALPADKRDDETLARTAMLVFNEYKVHWNVKTVPYEGIPELLDKMTSLRMQLAILSNKPDEYTKQSVDQFLPRWNFNPIIGVGKFPPKPNTGGATAIIDKLGVDPARIIYIGDSGVDMKTATDCGFFPVGVLWGFRERDELIEHGAKELIETPQDLFKLL
jgi:phosphoglycolate phosphatase